MKSRITYQRKDRRPLQPTGDLRWTSDTRVTFGPAFLYDIPTLHRLPEFDDYARCVEDARSPRRNGIAGTRTLQDAAIECILRDFHRMTLEAVKCLPISLIRHLWHEINQRGLLCFDSWRIFSELLSKDEASSLGLLRYRQAISCPKSPLSAYITPLTSTSFDFITSLSIAAPFTVPEFVHLSNLTNLGTLEITGVTYPRISSESDLVSDDVSSSVTDRVVRAWSHAALENGAFKVLRVLKLYQHEEVTDAVLGYIEAFPALMLFEVQDCHFSESTIRYAADLGWFGWSCDSDAHETALEVLTRECAAKACGLEGTPKTRDLSVGKPEALWDGSRIHWLSREFAIQSLTKRWNDRLSPAVASQSADDALQRSLNSLSAKTEVPVGRDRFTVCDYDLFQAISNLQTWDYESYTQFHLIGQLRDDADLKVAGMSPDLQALVCGSIVSGFPMAVIRLGPAPATLKTLVCDASQASPDSYPRERQMVNASLWKRKVRKFAFIPCSQPRTGDEALPVTGRTSVPGLHSKPRKKSHNIQDQTRGVMKARKKQKLADVLDHFG
ncbi:MAG: hypothetical protein M1818_007826 [Claussenomyces sp. TS43310]|nr:MAG: hypothetical protein M1818_007826 [Claussenomyces sp. TS43310]